MKRDNQTPSDVIDLGTASIETRGPQGPVKDEQAGILFSGLSDD